MVGKRHAGKRRHRLALAARRDEYNLLLRVTGDHVEVDEQTVRHFEITELARNGHDVHHASAGKRHFSSVLFRAVDNLLHAADVRRKRCDDEPLFIRFRAGKECVKRRVHLLLRLCVAGALCVRRVRHQQQNALLTELRKARKVDHAALRGGEIDLKVARVDNDARRGVQRKTHSVGNGVVYVDKLHVEAAELNVRARRCDVQLHIAEVVLLELIRNQRHRQRRAIHRHIDLFEQIRQGTDVVLMTVRDDNTADAVLVFLNKCEIRNNRVDAGHFLVREGKAAVHDNHVVFALKQREILADFI